MLNFSRYFTLLEGMLREHNVINQSTLDEYVATFVERTQPEIGKAWFKKKLRTMLLNDDSLLRAVNAEAAKLLSDVPPFVTQAVARGETVHEFVPNAPAVASLTERMNHISDWFNALALVASRPGQNAVEIEDQKLAAATLNKIPKVSSLDATATADAWFEKMGSRVAAEKRGVEVIMRFPDGFYVVRYTDEQTMTTDGHDLQNCLRQGYYWKDVRSGAMVVYGIRKANDEAVVGMRATRGKPLNLVECKGKNNEPVIQRYVPYVCAFLSKMKFDVQQCHDLAKAGITVRNGQFGSFTDLADVVHDANGLKIVRTDTRFMATWVGHEDSFEGTISRDTITGLTVDDVSREEQIIVLNLLGLAASMQTRRSLEEDGIYSNEGRYGTLQAVGTKVIEVGDVTGYHLEDTSQIGRVMISLYRNDSEEVGNIAANAQAIVGISEWELDASESCAVFNKLGLSPSDNAVFELQRFGIFHDGRQYLGVADLGEPVIQAGAVAVHKLGRNNTWLVTEGEESFDGEAFRFTIRGKTMKQVTADGRPITRCSNDFAKAIRELAISQQLRAVENGEVFGIIGTRSGIAADYDGFIKVFNRDPDAPYTADQEFYDCAKKTLVGLDASQQAKIYETFRPASKPFVLIDKGKENKVYDITIPAFEMRFPLATLGLIYTQVITDKSLIKKVAADFVAATKEVAEFIKTQQFATIELPEQEIGYGSFALRLDGPFAAQSRKLTALLYALKEKTDAAISERRRNPDKYSQGADISSRFAALNTFRKSSGY